MPIILGPYDQKVRVALNFPEQGRTKQSHKDECDINKILARFQRTGTLEHAREISSRYGDVSSVDFQTAMDNVIRTREWFAGFPSSIRKRFNNDPAEFLQFIEDPANADEAVALGLVERPKESQEPPTPAPAPEPATPSPAPAGGSAAG